MTPIQALLYALREEKCIDPRPITALNITQELWLRILAEDVGGELYPANSDPKDEKKLFGYPVNIVTTESISIFEHGEIIKHDTSRSKNIYSQAP